MQDPTPVKNDENEKPVFMTVETDDPDKRASDTPQIAEPPPSFPPSINSGNNSKRIAAILGVIALVGATGSGVFLVGRQQLSPASAWDCGKYNFAVSREGIVSVINGSTKNEPLQKANVSINATQVASFDVPALSPGQSANLGTVTVPANTTFSWEVIGTVDCRDGGSYQANSSSASCTAVKAFNKDWQQLTGTSLAALKAGDIVRFSVGSTVTGGGTIDKARFTINGSQRAEVTTKRPGTDEYYDEYTVPANTTQFVVTAQVHHQQTNQWYY